MEKRQINHIWFKVNKTKWKCCLCGGILSGINKPEPEDDVESYEPLTKEERKRRDHCDQRKS